MNNELPEAPAVIFTNYKRPDGFEVSLTFRGENGTKLLDQMELAIEYLKSKGCTPVTRSYGKASVPFQNANTATKTCEVHQTPMKEKVSKNTGKPYFSHSEKNGEEWRTCFGKGFLD